MNHLITEIEILLNNGNFGYAVCGGYALELFLNKEIRTHGDVDISVYWDDRDKVILYMKSLGWEVYEMCGNGMAHLINNINRQLRIKRNIFCVKDNCELVKLYPQDETDMFYLEFDHKGQTKLNFLEFLFNHRTDKEFIYARNTKIIRALSKAILKRNGISYLAPELVLLYKSTDINRDGYELDYRQTMSMMNTEQKQWLKNALDTMYPTGHKWAHIEA